MKKSITFIHPSRYQRVEVRVGPDPLLLLAGAVALSLQAWTALSGEAVPWGWLAGGAVLAHARLWRHALTLPVVASVALALMSGGMSMAITAVVVHKLVAQRYRHAGWKIRNTDGELGEYSSRFLAVHQLGFSEVDLMANVVNRHLRQGVMGLEKGDTPIKPLPTRMRDVGAHGVVAPIRSPDRPYIRL